RIVSDQTVPLCRTEEHTKKFQRVVHCRSTNSLTLRVTPLANVLHRDLECCTIRPLTKESEKRVGFPTIESVSGVADFDLLGRQPFHGKLPQREIWHRISGHLFVEILKHILNLAGGLLCPRYVFIAI